MTVEVSGRHGVALLVVDVQQDFCEGGSLAVSGGAAVAARIAQYLARHRGRYDAVVATRDWHIHPGRHFADQPDYHTSWPRHCVAGTPGAALHPALGGMPLDAVFEKGQHAAAYSGFEGTTGSGTTLAGWIAQHGIDRLDVAGLATDYCVRATVLDARRLGLGVTVLEDLIAGVDPATTATAVEDMVGAGAGLAVSAS